MKMQFLLLILISTMVFACEKATPTSNKNVMNDNKNVANTAVVVKKDIPVYTYEVVKTYNHDPKAFTQGLQYHNGFLYESTGENGKSSLRKVEIESGKVLQKHNLAREVFAEGMTILKDKIYQITWQNGVAYSYDFDFKMLKEFSYQGEGWGITNDGTNLIMSDGTHLLQIIDPETFKTIRTIPVMNNGKPLFLINELEYIKGEVWANIWQSEQAETQTTQGTMQNIGKPNYIARIDMSTGNVVGWIDLDKISPEDSAGGYVNSLNGIAYDQASEKIFITGKNWKKLFEIKVKAK